MDKTKIAVIGLGGIAQLVHLPNLSKLEIVRISAVAELNKNRLTTIADKFNVTERFTDYNEMLAKAECDAVIVATPTSSHKEISIACLNAKKHVLVEKPLARSFDEAKQIAAAAKKNKKNLMVGMNLRFRPDSMILKSLINSGEIGEPFYIKCGWIRRQSSEGKWFTKKEEAGGGVIIDLGILLLDLSLWLIDYPEIETISAQCYYQNSKQVEDSSMSFIRCKNSSLIVMETSWSFAVEKDSFYLTVIGTKGNASLNPIRILKKLENNFIDLSPSQNENSLNLFKKSYMNELRAFISCVRGVSPLISSGIEAVSRMKLVDAMYRSALKKMEVKV